MTCPILTGFNRLHVHCTGDHEFDGVHSGFDFDGHEHSWFDMPTGVTQEEAQ